MLVIDDEPSIVTALCRELGERPFQVARFTDPLQARDAALHEEYALIISDNLMPGLRGLDLLAQVQGHHPDTRRILLTGRTGMEEAVAAFNAGAIHRFLQKPWAKRELLAVLDQELQTYRERKDELAARDNLEQTAKKRASLLYDLVAELKQAQTQLALYADASKVGGMVLPASVRRLSILVVDEHQGVRERMESTLRKAGILDSTAVASGPEALAYLHFSPPVDVVLAEWNMPLMDGLTLFRALRDGPSASDNAMFILLTSREQREAVEVALAAGVDGYVIKPFHLGDLLAQVERAVLKHQRQLRRKLKALKPLSFLVANSDHTYATQIEHLLVTNGIRNVTVVNTGQKALNRCYDRPPDLLIYDCNLHDPYWRELHQALPSLAEAQPALVVTSAVPLQREFEDVLATRLRTFYTGPLKSAPFIATLFKAHDRAVERSETAAEDR